MRVPDEQDFVSGSLRGPVVGGVGDREQELGQVDAGVSREEEVGEEAGDVVERGAREVDEGVAKQPGEDHRAARLIALLIALLEVPEDEKWP